MKCACSWADVYSIDLESQIDRDKPVQMRVVLKDGQTGAISNGNTTIRLLPTKVDKDTVKFQAEILEQTKKGLISVSKPTIIVRVNSAGEIFQQAQDGTRAFRLKILPKLM